MTLHEFHARRWAMVRQWQVMHRIQPLLWRMSKITGEKPDLKLFQEEFIRANGRRTPPLPVLNTDEHEKLVPRVMNTLCDNDSTKISARAQHVRYGSPMTQRIVDVGLFKESIPYTKMLLSSQNLLREDIARTERTMVPNPPDDDEE